MRISDWSSDVCSSDLRCSQPTALRTAGLGSRQEGLEARSLGRPQSRRRSRQAQAGGRKRRSPLAADGRVGENPHTARSEEHTSELQSLMRISYAVFCLKKKTFNTILDTYNICIMHKVLRTNFESTITD